MGHIYFYLCTLLLINVALVNAVCPWTQTGVKYWSQASTWAPLPVPTLGTNVSIPSGMLVVYDVTTPGITYAGITVNAGAQLILDGTKNVVLESYFINVVYGATFYIGSSDCHYTTQASITLFGAYDNTTNYVPHMGVKNVIVQGTVEWYGNPPQPTWTTITSTANVGASTITVKDTLTNWKVGDSIVLASTDYYQQLTEEFTIVSISGKTITLDRPVAYMHWGANSEFAEVGHISRNIKIQGDAQSDVAQFGAHCIVIGNGLAHVYGVEFSKSGQRGILARYPFHWHYMKDQIGRGHFINESSFHDNYQRCVTVHGTSGVAVQNNVGYNITGHCYFLEEGSETFNTYIHNLGMVINNGPMIPSDSQASVFWITNPNNTFVNNVAVGGTFGFWYSLPENPIGMSTNDFSYMFPRFTALLRFDYNLAHGALQNGMHCDDGPYPNGTVDLTPFTPLSGPLSNTSSASSKGNAPIFTTIIGNNAFKNRQHGMWFRGAYITIANSLLQDNGIGVNMPTTQNVFTDSIIVGESPNYGTPNFTKNFNDQGRSRPQLRNLAYAIGGWSGYDDGGRQLGRNITFLNFTNNIYRLAGCLTATVGKNVLPVNNYLAENHIGNNNVFAMNLNTVNHDNPKFFSQIDVDGTLTGSYGNAVSTNNSFMTSISSAFSCTILPQWGYFANCTRNPDGYSEIQVTNTNTAGTDFGNSLTYPFRATFTPFGHAAYFTNVTGQDTDDTVRNIYVANMVSRHGYLLSFPHPTPPDLKVALKDPFNGEWVVMAFQYPAGTTFTITRASGDTLVPTTSVSNLTPYNYYFDNTNEYLYVMIYSDSASLTSPQGFPWSQDSSEVVNIAASCGKTCKVTTAHNVPAALVDNEDHYQAFLSGCGSNSGKEGYAYFRYNKKNMWVTYTIFHNILEATTGAINVNGEVYQVLPVGQAPIRGGFPVSWLKNNALWNGNWSVTIYDASHPSGSIEGKVGCVGTCVGPTNISSYDPCSPLKGENLIFSDSVNISMGWKDISRNVNNTYNYTASVRCGATALATNYVVNGNVLFKTLISTNTSTYKYFQFDVQSPAGPTPVPLTVSAQDTSNTLIGSLTLNSSFIDNYIIEETWTRVKVPLSALGFPTNGLIVGTFGIQMRSTSPLNWQINFDQIRLVPSYNDPNNKAPYGHVAAYSPSC